jgi:hypothetical protein
MQPLEGTHWYTAPPKKTWVALTVNRCGSYGAALARAWTTVARCRTGVARDGQTVKDDSSGTI